MDLVIFDCDGVLVDSETLSCTLDAEMLATIGVPLTAADVMREYTGIPLDRMLADVARRYGVRIPEGFHARCEARFEEAIEERLEAIPGIAPVVEKQRGRSCVASSSSLARVRRSLQRAGLLEHFGERIFVREMVEHRKPAPDLFLLAATTLGAAAVARDARELDSLLAKVPISPS